MIKTAGLTSGLILTGALLLTACQPAPNGNNAKFGRNAYGSPAQRPGLATTQSTVVTNGGGDLQMTAVAQLFAAPALNALLDFQLGNVSANSGVTMWAEAYLIGGADAGTLAASQSRIHIEVADSRVGQSDNNGGRLAPFVLHIGYDNAGFEGADGGVSGGQVALRFDQSGYGSVLVTGVISGSQFSGTLSFVNTMTDGQVQDLGNFTLPTCSFFVCGQ